VVCISATDGAGGPEIGRDVAAELGFRLVNEGIVLQAARDADVEPRVVADAERRKSFVARLLEGLAPGGAAAGASLGAFAPMSAEELATPSGADLRALIRTAVEETAARGNAVILAHAASLALAEHPQTLRVLVTAGLETRRRRVSQERGLDAAAARTLVSESDKSRAAYLEQFYDVVNESSTHYDLVINTDRLTTGQAVDLIVRAAGALA
jgi:CMP/dCMP kinase